VPLQLVSTIDGLAIEKLQRRNQFRTITVSAFPAEGLLASEVLMPILARVEAYGRTLPPGYTLEIGGEYEKQMEGFSELTIVMLLSVVMIFLALVVQFKHAIKPLLVFAAIPYVIVGALFALWIMGAPFGFTGFLGIASLVGVIVSHVIVLFDFIEEKHAEVAPLQQALVDAGIMLLRPVLITVGAAVIALFPLAPWRPAVGTYRHFYPPGSGWGSGQGCGNGFRRGKSALPNALKASHPGAKGRRAGEKGHLT
jgi:multidrug efflux pump subunit AcrB